MKNTIRFILCLLFGLNFVNAGLNKFFHYIPVPEKMPAETLKDFGAMMEISWLMPLIAAFEITGGILFIIPKTRALGAIILVPIMAGILLHHTTVDHAGLIVAILMALVLIWIICENRNKYLHMVS